MCSTKSKKKKKNTTVINEWISISSKDVLRELLTIGCASIGHDAENPLAHQ